MAANFNSVVLAGNLTRDIELKYVASGTAVAELTLAINEFTGKGDNRKEVAHFFDVTLWGKQAEIAAEHLKKGSSILIRGRLRQDQWEKDGQKRSAVRVTAEEMQMLGSPRGDSSRTEDSDRQASGGKSSKQPSDKLLADLPF